MYLLIFRALKMPDKRSDDEPERSERPVENVIPFEHDKLAVMQNLAEAHNRTKNSNSKASIVQVQDDGLCGFLATNREYDMQEYADKTTDLINSVNSLQQRCVDLQLCLHRKINSIID